MDYGKYKIYYVHGRTDEERQFLMFPERRKNDLHSKPRIQKEIYCMNEVTVNTKLLDFLSQNHVIVHFFNYYDGTVVHFIRKISITAED